MKLTRWVLATSVCIAGTLISGSRALSAQGTITGRVTAAEGSEVLADARVMVVGTSVATTSGPDGRFTLRNVPTGAQQVRVLRVGYQERKQPASVVAGQSLTLDFALTRAIVQLQEIVTTATGEQRKVELGNSVATLGDVSKRVQQESITDMADLLVAKAPGMTVLQGSYSMTAPTIRIRGLNSVSLGNAPIFIIDGVRMNTGTFAGGNSNPPASYINDIDPQTIEDIEIVKGPSAATLYGTDAANGVVVITTKRGRAGATKWIWSAEAGAVDDRSKFLDTYMIFGHTTAAPTAVVRCVLIQVSAKSCIPDSTSHLNPMMMDSLTPLNIGHRNAYNVQTSGGNDALRFFVSGGIDNEIGPTGMPDFSIRRLDSLHTSIRDEWLHPEAYQKENVQANLNVTLSPTMTLAISSQFLKVDQRLPQVNNNFYSSPYQSMMSPGFSHPGPGYKGIGTLGEQLHGYNGFVPSEINQSLTQDGVQGLIGNVQAEWRPFSWMQNNGSTGIDLRNRVGYNLCRFGECPYFGDPKQVGSVSSSTNNLRNFSGKLTSVSSWQARKNALLQTTIGADYTNQEDDNTSSNSSQLPPGGQTVGQGAVQGGGNQPSRASKTLGLYAQEQLSLRDRMFLTVAVRSDQNSAFGVNFQRVAYPKASLSWILSDESFFPHYDFLNTFRLRSAYGASGVNPGATAGLITFNSSTVNIPPTPNSLGTDTPGLVSGALGNPNLKPETSSEFEGGFESRLFNRINVDFTYYSKKTKDALINQQIAPSAAAPVTSVLRNLGSVANSGVEVSLNMQLVDRRAFGWDMTVGGSHLSNKLISLGNDASGLPNKTIGTGTSRDSVGLPLNSLFYRTYTYADANGDGIITQNEVTVNPNYQYLGYSIPRDVISIQNGFDLFNRKLRINVSGDYKGGLQVFNSAAQFQCAQNLACQGASDQTASLADQAANVANRYATGADLKGVTTPFGYLQSGQFWRLREVSGTFTLPNAISARLAHASSTQITFAARNLKVWTKYKGSDPEETAGTGDTQATFGNAGPRTYFTGRLVLHY